MKKVLIVGESWVKNITHIKGFDTFVTTHYE
ncbi:TPA: glutamine amidotransferase, partial [Clostridioides difficile]